MKKMMFLISALLVTIPFVNVKAEDCASTGTCKVYSTGDVVNFYANAQQKEAGDSGVTETGVRTVVIESSDSANSQYVKAMVLAAQASPNVYYDPEDGSKPFELVKKDLISKLSSYEYVKSLDELTIFSKEEAIKLLNATLDTTTGNYVVSQENWYKVFDKALTASYIAAAKQANSEYTKLAFYTSNYSVDTLKVDVIELDYTNGVENLTITFKETDLPQAWETNKTQTVYYYLPVLSFDKTMDCQEKTDKYACYSCNETYAWYKVGAQGEGCALVESINAKKDCATQVKTGVEDYYLPLAIVVVIGLGSLFAVRRKNSFRGI